MKNKDVNFDNFEALTEEEIYTCNGGDVGDAAYWIGRVLVHSTLAVLTGGASVGLLLSNQL